MHTRLTGCYIKLYKQPTSEKIWIMSSMQENRNRATLIYYSLEVNNNFTYENLLNTKYEPNVTLQMRSRKRRKFGFL